MIKLTEPQRKMLIASEPDDITGEEGCGVPLGSVGELSTARALARKELGYVDGDLYFNNAEGLVWRREELGLDEEDGDLEDDFDAAFERASLRGWRA